MRAAVTFFLVLLSLTPAIFADDPALTFQGSGTGDTPAFRVVDRWEVQWNGTGGSVSVEDQEGNVLMGSSSMGPGSIYIPHGGNYKLHVSIHPGLPWKLNIVALGAAGTMAATSATPYYSPPDMLDNPMNASSPTVPPSALPVAGAALLPATPPSKLSEAQAAGVVLIKGDTAEGTGFLVKTPSGPVVVTNQHVLANNPNIQITTSTGETIKQLGLQGASDRDLAMISIQDNNYSYLEMATDLGNTVQVGDQVITPGNSQGGDVMLNTPGTVLGLGPQRVEISNPIYHGNSGGPVLHVKSGKVIGVVNEAIKVDTTNSLDKASFSNQNSAITGEMRYFGLRFDSVPHWDAYTWQRFNNETAFLGQFHERSKCLDSYLNTANNDTTDWGLYYLRDEKVKAANEHLSDMATGGDSSQRMEAWRNLIFELDAVSDTDMPDIQMPSNFYAFDQIQARNETTYRQELKKEIDDMSNDMSRDSNLARRNN